MFSSKVDIWVFSDARERENDDTQLSSQAFKYIKKLDWSLSLPA